MTRIHPQARSTSTALIAVCATLMVVGVVMIATASASLDRSLIEEHFWKSRFGRQVVFVALGFLALVVGARACRPMLRWSHRTWLIIALLLFVCTVGALVAVLLPGIGAESHGARRWLEFGPPGFGVRFQPSEPAKIALVVLLAALLARPAVRVQSFWRGLLPGALAVAVIALLVGKEDFGTAALLMAVGGLMLLTGGCRVKHLALMAVPAIAGLWYLIQSKSYRLDRLLSFWKIWEDPQGAGYHPIQSLLTIASGGWLGRGLGNGIQKYGYLPESRTDFIFSVICEEAGLVGGLIVILLFVVFLWLGGKAALHAPTAFQRMLAFGLTITIVFQAAMNIAVVTVLAPTKGIALPLVSAGGSGIVFLGAGLGLLAAVAGSGCYDTSPRSAPAERGEPHGALEADPT